jgi:hypothetical protein
MRKDRQHKRGSKDAPNPQGQPPHPSCGLLPNTPRQGLAQELPEASGEMLPFRVDLPSRRWLELAAGNGAPLGSPP